MSLIHNHKEEAQIIADAIRDGLGSIAGHVKDVVREASIRHGQYSADNMCILADSVAALGERFATDAEADSLGKRPAYITDGLFAIARAINRVAEAMEASVRAVNCLEEFPGDDWKDEGKETEG